MPQLPPLTKGENLKQITFYIYQPTFYLCYSGKSCMNIVIKICRYNFLLLNGYQFIQNLDFNPVIKRKVINLVNKDMLFLIAISTTILNRINNIQHKEFHFQLWKLDINLSSGHSEITMQKIFRVTAITKTNEPKSSSIRSQTYLLWSQPYRTSGFGVLQLFSLCKSSTSCSAQPKKVSARGHTFFGPGKEKQRT